MSEEAKFIIEQLTIMVHTEMAALKADMAELKTDMAELKTEVAELKAEVAELKTEVENLETRVDRLEVRVTHLEARMESVEVAIKEVLEPEIHIIAEGHLDLDRKLMTATSFSTELENLKIRMKSYEMALMDQKKLCDARHVLAC